MSEPDTTLLRLLHHAAAEHCRVWHGAVPTKERTLPLRELLNAVDLVGEHLGEKKINRAKAKEERRREEAYRGRGRKQ